MIRLRVILLFLALVGAGVARAQVVTETFQDASAAGWVFSGTGFTPYLTSGVNDTSGDGWLRLTSTGTNQSTSAYYNTAFTATNATIYASFEYQSWGGSGADGITFFLFDGSKTFAVGADGGSLGYAQKTGVSGLNGGYLGVAIDEFGNFSNPTEGRVGGTGFYSDSFAVRGPGSGETGYDYLGGTTSLSTSIDSPGATTRPTTINQVQILISPTNQLTVSLQQGAASAQTVLQLDLSGYERPDTLMFGFSSGTGSLTNYHEVRNLNVTTLVANLWDGATGDGLWGTSNNWDPNILPASGADLLFNNTYATSAQTIATGTNRTVRSLSFDAPFSYTLNNNTITFDAASVPGFTGIAVTQTRGSAPHTINSNLALANDIIVRNNSAGTLALNGAIALGANDITYDGTGTTAVEGNISGTGSVVKNETGTLLLNGTNTYSGGTTISGGTVSTDNNSGLGSGTITLTGGALTSTASNTLTNATTLSGNATVADIMLSGSFTQSGGDRTLTLNNATLSGAVALSNDATGRTLTVNTDTGATSTISGVISNGGAGAGGLNKTGAGELVLSGTNTYTGSTTISNGTLTLGDDNVLGAGAVTIGASGTLNLAGNSEQIGNLTASGGATIDFGAATGDNTLVFANYSAPSSGVLVVNNWESGGDTLATTVTGQNVSSIYISGYGVAQEATTTTPTLYGSAYLLTPVLATEKEWDGSSNQYWSTSTTYSANWTSPNAPTSSQVAVFGNLGVGRPNVQLAGNYTIAGIKFDSDATVSYSIGQYGTRTLTLSGSVPYIQQKSAFDQSISIGTLALGASTVADITGAGDLTITSTITGTNRALIKDGTGDGKLILGGTSANTFSGGVYINNGIVQAQKSGALGTGTTVISAGAGLELAGGTGSLAPANAMMIAGSGVDGAGVIHNVSGTNTLSGTITQSAASTIAADAGSTLTLSGNLTGTNTATTFAGAGDIAVNRITTGTAGVTIASTGTVTYQGTTNANTYTGTTTVNSGTLVLSKTAGTNAIAGNLVVGDGTGTDTVLLAASNQIANSATVTVNSSGVFNLDGNSETIAELDGVAGAVVQLGAGTLGISGAGESVFAGSFSGTGALQKTGTGKLSLSGSSSGYSGAVTLSTGIINVSGSAASMLGTGAVTVSGTGNLELQGGASLANAMTLSSNGTGALDGALQNIAGNNSVTGNLTLASGSRVQSDSGSLTLSGNVGLAGNTLNVGGSGNTTISGVISGAGGLTKDGSGNLLLTASNTFTGATAINEGVITLGANNVFADAANLSLAATGTLALAGFDDTVASISGSGSVDFGSAGTSALSLDEGVSYFSGQFLGTGELIIGEGATLTLGADITNLNLKITLAGGTLNLNGYTGSFGDLSITAGSSIIDFGSGIDSTLNVDGVSFANTSLVLSVNNWTDSQDYFYSTSNPGPQGSTPTNQIHFNGFSGNDTRWLDYDTQVTPVPEPSTYGALFIGALLGFFLWRRRVGRQ